MYFPVKFAIFFNFLTASPLTTSGRLLLLLSLKTPNYWVFLSFLQLFRCLFIEFLVQLAYVLFYSSDYDQRNTFCFLKSLYLMSVIIATWFSFLNQWADVKTGRLSECFTLGLGKTAIPSILVSPLDLLLNNKINNF